MRAAFAPYEDVKTVIYDDEIYDRITDDNCPPKKEFVLPESGYVAVGGYVGDIASLFMVHGDKMHFMVIKEYRKHSKDLLDLSFELYPRNVYCEIPSLYRSVINFALNYGFKETAISKLIYRKNGLFYNVHRLEYEV